MLVPAPANSPNAMPDEMPAHFTSMTLTTPADSTVSYRIPWRMQGGIRIEFELAEEERSCITEVMIVDPGNALQVRILSRIRYDRWCERPIDRL